MNSKAELLGSDGAPITGKPVNWDQQPAPPTEPPTPVPIEVPDGLEKYVQLWRGVAAREGLLFDICLERAIRIVERNFLAGLVGIDHFSEQGVGAGGRLAIVSTAIPIAIEMHKHVIAAINELGAKADATGKNA